MPNMAVTYDDLEPGLELNVKNQGTCITPIEIKVTIQWVCPIAVYYTVEGDSKIKETTIERFLEIVNQ